MKKIISKKEYNDGIVAIEWDIPRGIFKAIGILGIGTLLVGCISAAAGNEYASQILNTCKCFPFSLFVFSSVCLVTGTKKNK